MDWTPGYFPLFMSHLAEHAAFVSDVKSELADYGIDGFVAHEDIEPTREWEDEIIEGLNTCSAMAVVLHEGFHESAWTDQEVGFVIARTGPGGQRIKIIPLRFHLAPYGFIGRFQAIDCRHLDAAGVAGGVFDALFRDRRTQLQIEDALIQALSSSESYDEANRRSRRIEAIEVWSRPQLVALADAFQRNDQVRRGFTSERIVRTILETNPLDEAAPF